MRALILLLTLPSCMDYGVTAQDDQGDPHAPPGPHPQILVEPPELHFGDVRRAQTGYGALSITNVGEEPLRLIELVPPETSSVRLGQLTHTELAPGETTGVGVSWVPMDFTELSSELYIESNDPTTPLVAVPLSGRVPAPRIALDPLDHDFGVIDRGTIIDLPITVTNEGEDDLRVSGVTYNSTSTEELFVEDLGAISDLPLTLAPGADTVITVRYQPFDDIADEGNLIVSSDDPANPEANASQVGNGTPGRDYDVEIFITSDDEWEGELNGVSITGPGAGDWREIDSHLARLSSGKHVLTIRSWDKFRVVAGMISYITVDGDPWYVSGDGSFKLSRTEPPSDWTEPDFDMSGWPEADLCNPSDASVWGTSRISDFLDAGAQWIWHSTDCRVYGQAWFRVEIELP